MGDQEILPGGVANAGAVVREGRYVLRPSRPHTGYAHALFRHVRSRGFGGVPEPLGVDPDGRERLVFIPGEVAVPPFPAWSQRDVALASMAALLRRFHEATTGFVPPDGATPDTELADPQGGAVADTEVFVCHNDVCMENVVYRDGMAVALLDFDFAAPGRALHDLAALARMCIPLDTAADAAVWGWGPLDPFARLRAVADAYGLAPGRVDFVDVIGERIHGAGGFVRGRVERGEPAFVAMWEKMGGQARFDRRRDWFDANRDRFVDALA